jgi:hypothetical protein
VIQVRKGKTICFPIVAKFFKKKTKKNYFTEQTHFFPKMSFSAFFSLENHTGITFCETRAPIVDSN